MLSWVVMNRPHPPQTRKSCLTRAQPRTSSLFTSQLSTFNLQLLTSFVQHSNLTIPNPCPNSHSHFGSHLTPVPEKSNPFFSCTYVGPILHPLCFQIHAWNGGGGSPPPNKNGTTPKHNNRYLHLHPQPHRHPAQNPQ